MNREKKRVLIIDDDPDFISIVSTILEVGDFDVITAIDPEAGLATAIEEQPDIILLDVIFYGETLGFEYCRKMKNNPNIKNIPLIMVTSVGDIYGVDFWPADKDFLPADDFISKPVRQSDLINRIEKLLVSNEREVPNG